VVDDSVYERQNFGNSVGFGSRPALLIVDFQVGFIDPAVFGGGNIKEAVANTAFLLAGMREIGAPVAYTRAVFDEEAVDGGTFAIKVPGLYRLK
jgi:maleamate amidohydrolase